MPLDDLPGTLIIPQRDDIRDQYLRDIRIRRPGAVTVANTPEFAAGSVFADGAAPIYFDAKNIGDFAAATNKTGPALDTELARAGTKRLPAAGGSGAVIVGASVGGGQIFSGDICKDPKTQFQFQCTRTAIYNNGDEVPIQGIDTGPLTDLAEGTIVQWNSPRPGIYQNAVVVEQADGSGLSGGRDQESDDDANKRLQELRGSPAASGNDADFQAAIQQLPGIAIQQCFTYPCCLGPGTIGVTFTLRPGTPGGNRIPNSTQLGAAHSFLIGQFPTDDSILMISLISDPIAMFFETTWAPGAAGWADQTVWPLNLGATPVAVDGAVTPTATTFRLTTTTATSTPKIGQSVAFYDQPNGAWRRKKILTVSVVSTGLSWDITVDPSNGVSDVSYIPIVGQAPGPWSDSLTALISPIVTYFDTIGPGEMFTFLPDPNLRGHRTPRSPISYPNTITNRIVTGIFALPTVEDTILLEPTIPAETPAGLPGILAYLQTLGSITVYAL